MNSKSWMSDLGKTACQHRKQAGLTQAELALLAGVGKTVVFDLEKGKTTIRVETLLRILTALNLDLTWTSPLEQDYA